MGTPYDVVFLPPTLSQERSTSLFLKKMSEGLDLKTDHVYISGFV